jgi:hypothetical protein
LNLEWPRDQGSTRALELSHRVRHRVDEELSGWRALFGVQNQFGL